ncbi:MAG: PCP reductase family protein, partial [Nitrospirae bacterium]|nr:PCP reductase family protein [Nitrospirota bacterium]
MSVSPAENAPAVRWTPDAEARLERAPAFLRPVVRKIAEKRAREAGVAEITGEFLSRITNETVQGSEPRADAETSRADAGSKAQAGREIRSSSHSPIRRFTDRPSVTWTQEARSRTLEIPPAMREIVTKIVEEAAAEAGEPIVTAALFDRIEEMGAAAVIERAAVPWTEGARELLEIRLVRTPEPALPFARGAIMRDVEQ